MARPARPPRRCHTPVVTDDGVRSGAEVSGQPFLVGLFHSQLQTGSSRRFRCIRFGPDGCLYIGLGDGGKADDPHVHAQNLSTLLGSILWIDVDEQTTAWPMPSPRTTPSSIGPEPAERSGHTACGSDDFGAPWLACAFLSTVATPSAVPQSTHGERPV